MYSCSSYVVCTVDVYSAYYRYYGMHTDQAC